MSSQAVHEYDRFRARRRDEVHQDRATSQSRLARKSERNTLARIMPLRVSFIPLGFNYLDAGEAEGHTSMTTQNLIGYARVSTTDQDAALQLDALERAGAL